MKRKNYITPAVRSVELQQRHQLLSASQPNSSTQGDLGGSQAPETEEWSDD